MNNAFLKIVLSRPVVTNAIKVALVVGTILVLINHGGRVFDGSLSGGNIFQMIFTYFVPYCVSSYSSAKALQDSTLSTR